MNRLNCSGLSGFGLRGMGALYARPAHSSNGNRNWRGSSGAERKRRRLSEGRRFWAPRETSRSIGKPLALDATQQAIGASLIVDSERDAVVVAEIELCCVAVQVRLANVEIATVDAALEDREEVLDRIGVPECSTDILLRRMVDRAVPAELAPDAPIDRAFVGHQVGGLVDVGDDNRLQADRVKTPPQRIPARRRVR